MRLNRNRISRTVSAISLAALLACTPAAYFPSAQVVRVGDHDHTVRRSGESYIAQKNNTVFAKPTTDGEIYVGNLRAIRDATGCPVSVSSVVIEDRRTTAQLACPAGRLPRR